MPRSAAWASISTTGKTTSAGGSSVLELVGAHVAAAVPREAEVPGPAAVMAVDLARRLVVAHAVDLVVGEPELAGLGVEVVADRVADAGGIDLAALAVLVHPDHAADADLLERLDELGRRHVVRLAERDVELAVRPDAADPRGVVEALVLGRDQLARGDHRHRRRRPGSRRRTRPPDRPARGSARRCRASRPARSTGRSGSPWRATGRSSSPRRPCRSLLRSVTAQTSVLRVPTKVTMPCGPTAMCRASGTTA